MPSYDYVCRECGERFAIRLSIAAYSSGVRPTCAACGSTAVERSYSPPNVLTGSRGGAGSSASACAPSGFS
jgi:putative FmdB family regulatory protein